MAKIERQTWSIPEAAQVIGVSKPIAYSLVREGVIPYIRVGKRCLVPKRALEKWLDEAAKEGTNE